MHKNAPKIKGMPRNSTHSQILSGYVPTYTVMNLWCFAYGAIGIQLDISPTDYDIQ